MCFYFGVEYTIVEYVFYNLSIFLCKDISKKRLLKFWWFPESYEKHSPKHHNRRIRDRKMRLIREDIRDLTDIRHIDKLELLVSILESKVWSQFSIKSLIEDVWVTHKTLSHWIDILEYTYYIWRVFPFQSSRIKSLRKEPRMFLWDWSEVENEGARFENMIWSHLLKRVHRQQDTSGEDRNLEYLRDREGREVDFVLSYKWKLHTMIEVKKSDTTPSKHLHYFQKKFPEAIAIQVVYNLDATYDRDVDGIRVVNAFTFLSELV